MDEVLDFSMKKAKFSPAPLDIQNRITPEWRSQVKEEQPIPDSQRSDSSTGSNVSPQPSSTISPTSYPSMSLMSVLESHNQLSALMSGTSGLSGFPGFPGSPAMMSDSAFFPTASLALSALHRRRRNSSVNDSHNDGKKVKSVPDEKKVFSTVESWRQNILLIRLPFPGRSLLGKKAKEQRCCQTFQRLPQSKRGGNRSESSIAGTGESQAEGTGGNFEKRVSQATLHAVQPLWQPVVNSTSLSSLNSLWSQIITISLANVQERRVFWTFEAKFNSDSMGKLYGYQPTSSVYSWVPCLFYSIFVCFFYCCVQLTIVSVG